MDSKLTKVCPVEDAIRYLRLPDDAAPWILQSANFDPDFPRRYKFGAVNVVPLQLARFLILRGVGYLLEEGPAAFLLEEDDLEVVEPDAGGDDEDDPPNDDENGEDEEKGEEGEDDRPPRRGSRRRR